MQTEAATLKVSDVLAGLLDRETLAEQLGVKSKRTVIRYERAGMPFIVLGCRRLYDPEKVREWIMRRENRRNTAPRTAGRPRKAA